ncbi:hypothetical protein LLH23_11395 [bacterium]|nr:hypothetical protein [bacterium]
MRRVIVAVAVLVSLNAYATELPKMVLGDYDAELRGADGRVDIPLMIQRLQDMGANTYMWLIWHKPTDWEDLQAFLPEAQKANIQVWAYLCPHTEQGFGGLWSEPYRLDFMKWAEEIAKLSVKYPNLVGWVIDDFWYNVNDKAFSPEIIKQMQSTAKAINPELRFYPLLYFRQIGPIFAQKLAPLVDGVVIAYHQSREEIEAALPFLDDTYTVPPGLSVIYPPTTPSSPGDLGMVTQTAGVLGDKKPVVRFHYKDSCDGPTAGYHVMQLRVDGKVAWSEDVAGTDNGQAEVDLSPFTQGNAHVVLALGVYEAKGVTEYAVTVELSDLQVEGLQMNADLGRERSWQTRTAGKFAVHHGPKQLGQNRYKLPLIVMPAGSRGEYKHRYNEDATPENITARTRQALEMVGDGRVIGAVIYCLDKTKASPDLPAVRKLFDEFRKP